MKKVALVGASGKMGQEILSLLNQAKIKTTELSSSKKTLSKENLKGHDVVIDFSSPQGFAGALELSKNLGIPFLSGTTGISSEQKQSLALAAKKIPALWSPNMSLGIALMKKATELLAQLNGFDFQIEEFHHNQKKDRPSGTALALQESLAQALKKEKQKIQLPEPLVARAGGIVGIHKVYAVSNEELICFEHQALNRRVFASGAVRAAEWLMQQKPGLYQIEDMFNV